MLRCLQQSPWQVPDKVLDLSRAQIMNVGDVICVADFHDLCLQQVCDFVGNLSQTLSQSRRNGIWSTPCKYLRLPTSLTSGIVSWLGQNAGNNAGIRLCYIELAVSFLGMAHKKVNWCLPALFFLIWIGTPFYSVTSINMLINVSSIS